MTISEDAVERVIANMRQNLGEELTVDDMARVAMFSKFHFTRLFQRVTGVSPRRFLSALRLQQAKRLLVSTTLTVSDISMRVGYSSVGTFSTKFARSVGMSPTEYRRLETFRHTMTDAVHDGDGIISGRVSAPPLAQVDAVFIGVFPTRLAEGRPVRCLVLDGLGEYRLEHVPAGVWYLVCHSDLTWPAGHTAPGVEAVATHGPVEIGPRGVVTSADLLLTPLGPLDPPVLPALLEVLSAHQRATAIVRGSRRAS